MKREEPGASATLAVSGGSTPRLMFQSMARADFRLVRESQIFQVDERCVPPDDEQSNFRMIRESLLSKARIDESQFHRVPGELPPGRGRAHLRGRYPQELFI